MKKLSFWKEEVLMDEDFFLFVHVCIKQVKHLYINVPLLQS